MADFDGPPFPWLNIENLDRWNPSRPELLRQWATPTLVTHGEKDYRSPLTEGLAAFTTLQSLGTASRFLHLPGEGPCVTSPESTLIWLRVVLDWADAYTHRRRDSSEESEIKEGYGMEIFR